MSFAKASDKREVRFNVSGEKPMIGMHGGPDAAKFLPDHALLTFENGDLTYVHVSGPRIGVNGNPLKKDRLLTGYEPEDLLNPTTTDPEMEWDRPPQWLQDLVKNELTEQPQIRRAHPREVLDALHDQIREQEGVNRQMHAANGLALKSLSAGLDLAQALGFVVAKETGNASA